MRGRQYRRLMALEGRNAPPFPKLTEDQCARVAAQVGAVIAWHRLGWRLKDGDPADALARADCPMNVDWYFDDGWRLALDGVKLDYGQAGASAIADLFEAIDHRTALAAVASITRRILGREVIWTEGQGDHGRAPMSASCCCAPCDEHRAVTRKLEAWA